VLPAYKPSPKTEAGIFSLANQMQQLLHILLLLLLLLLLTSLST
jgi:hypothetical protein